MQIICNSCLSNRIYDHVLHKEYKNPFLHCMWTPADMLKFIKYYKLIDYSNINISYINNHILLNEKFNDNYIKCNIDNFITLYYTHPKKYNNDLDCFKEIYFNLLNKLDVNEDPIFILNYGLDYIRFYLDKNNIVNCIKFNFMHAKTIQLSTLFNIELGNPKINKHLFVSDVSPSRMFENAKTRKHLNNRKLLIEAIKELSEIKLSEINKN